MSVNGKGWKTRADLEQELIRLQAAHDEAVRQRRVFCIALAAAARSFGRDGVLEVPEHAFRTISDRHLVDVQPAHTHGGITVTVNPPQASPRIVVPTLRLPET